MSGNIESKDKEANTSKRVDSRVFNRLKRSYSTDFGGSPTDLLAKLNDAFPDKIKKAGDVSGNLISNKTIRVFFSATELDLPTTRVQNLNYLCKVMLGYDSYLEAKDNSIGEATLPSVVDKGKKDESGQQSQSDLEEILRPYYEKTRRKLNQLKVLDMRETFPLQELYAGTNFLVKSRNLKNRSDFNFLRDSDSTNFQQDQRTPAVEKIKKSPHLMIMGGPGAGKTSFLRNIGLRYLNKKISIQDFGKWHIPIYISLKISGAEIDKSGLEVIISSRFAGILEFTKIEKMLREGQFIILLDALDEYNNLEGICEKIEQFLDKYDENRFIVTTRLGIPEGKIEQLDEVKIADFEQDQVTRFVKNWFKISEKKDIEREDFDEDWNAERFSDEFLRELENNRSISHLSINPLILTYLCLKFKEQFGSPKNSSGLFADVVKIFLQRWDAGRRIRRIPNDADRLSDERKIEIFAQIAYNGFTKDAPRQLLWEEHELQQEVSQFLQKMSTISASEISETTKLVLQVLIRDHGLFVPLTDTRYAFPHLAFQQYFVAEYIHNSLSSNTAILREALQNYLFDRHWERVFLMLSEKLNNADELFRAMFQNINLAIEKRGSLTTMLEWIHKITRSFKVDSSAWRAFILATDLEVTLYFKRNDIVNYSYAQEFSEQTVDFNQKRGKITPNQPKFVVALYLVIIYDLALDRTEDESTRLKRASEYTQRELEVDSDTTISGQFELAIAKAKQVEDMPNLIDDLQRLQNEIPSESDSSTIWQSWTNKLQTLMRDRFDLGHQSVLTTEDEKALEEYIYGNNLLLKCILGENVSTPRLREAIFDQLLLPPSEITKYSYL